MSLARIQSFQTSDGRLFTDKVVALQHQFVLDVRGLIQSSMNTTRSDNFTSTQLAEAITKKPDLFQDVIRKHKEALRRATPKPVGA